MSFELFFLHLLILLICAGVYIVWFKPDIVVGSPAGTSRPNKKLKKQGPVVIIESHLETVYKHTDPRQEATPQKTHPYKYCPEVECSSCIFVKECNYVKPVPERDM